MKKFKKKLTKFFTEILVALKRHAKNKLSGFIFLNIVIFVFQLLYILFRRVYLNAEIPLWYTRPWGDYQLASSEYIFIIPAGSIFISLCGFVFIALINKYFVRYIADIISIIITFYNLLLTWQMLRIFSVASVPFEPFINPLYLSLLPYFAISFFVANYSMPWFIDLMKKLGMITNPNVHNHPSMLLKGPSARGGGILFTALFLILSLFMVGFSKDFFGFYISLLLVGILSFIDDYQNTHPASSFKIIENPLLRLMLLVSVVSITVMSGFRFDSITNPLQTLINGAFLNFTNFQLISGVLTIIWIVWFMNVLSWSNGVDGQYSGIVGIGFIVVAILSLRFDDLSLFHKKIAILAIISSGLSFGTVRHMWHPSKVMWGFGAVSAGLVLAVLSFLSQSKIITSIIIILIPFLDASVTLLRRMFQGKNPLKGDKYHLHHLLLRNGWSVAKISLFYWVTTAVFGLIGVLTAEKLTIQVGLVLVGLVAFAIIILNLKYLRNKDENTIYRR